MKTATQTRTETSIETVNAELNGFVSLASDPTTLPSVKGALVVGAIMVAAFASRVVSGQ